MSITASQVRKLREQTAAPLMACKKALQKTAGNLEEAILVVGGLTECSGEASGTRAATVIPVATSDVTVQIIVRVNRTL